MIPELSFSFFISVQPLHSAPPFCFRPLIYLPDDCSSLVLYYHHFVHYIVYLGKRPKVEKDLLLIIQCLQRTKNLYKNRFL